MVPHPELGWHLTIFIVILIIVTIISMIILTQKDINEHVRLGGDWEGPYCGAVDPKDEVYMFSRRRK